MSLNFIILLSTMCMLVRFILFHRFKFFVCEFPLAACKLLPLALLMRTPLQENLFHPEAFGNNSAPYKSGLKIERFNFFFKPFLTTLPFWMCGEQSVPEIHWSGSFTHFLDPKHFPYNEGKRWGKHISFVM